MHHRHRRAPWTLAIVIAIFAVTTARGAFTIPDSVAAVGFMDVVVSATWSKGVVEVARTIGGFTIYDTLSVGMPLEMTISAPSLDECYLVAQLWG